MLCIYVERYFESLICCLDVCLSSLLVAFISMCFSSKNLISSSLATSRQIPDKFSFYRAFFLFCQQHLNKFSIHRDFWVSSRQNLNSFFDPTSQISLLSVCSIDSQQIVRSFKLSFAVDKSLIALQQIHFCRDQCSTDSQQKPRSIELRFLYITEVGFQISFSHLFLNSFSFSFNPNTFLTLKSPHPHDFRPTSSSNHLVSILNPFIYTHSCILDLVIRFLKSLGFLRYLCIVLCSFGAICSYVASSLQYSNFSCILELCD